jgi:phage recombination protein Bet
MVTKEREAEKAIVAWQGRRITVTFDDVKRRICPRATDQEIIIFLKMCQTLNLNPWARDVYMVKYKEDEPASIIVATEAYLKAAETCQDYDGHEAGVVLKDSTGKLEFREGSLIVEEEESKLVGGWAKVYRKDRARPFYVAVNIKECQKYTREGKPTRFWREMPATMVRKVALSRALREAFPSRLGGMLTEAEYEEIPEELPPALEKGGKPDWKKFWAKVKSDLGLTTEEARQLLGVDSIKEELIDAGWTMERIWDDLTLALQQAQTPTIDDLKRVREKVNEAIARREVKANEDLGEIACEAEVVEAEVDSEQIQGEGFRIDLNFLKESLKALKWSEDTCKSFVVSKYKVSPDGSLAQVLQRLTKQQAEEFTKELSERLTQRRMI